MITEQQKKLMREAIALSSRNIDNGGGPFGAVIVKDGKILARGANRVTADNDPTAHAEVNAIREAARILGTFDLSGCEIYTSCEPCPMCLSAIYWARIDHIYYANTQYDAKAIDFDDSFIYEEDDGNADKYFAKILRGKALDADETVLLKSEIFRFMACEYACRGLVMQLHIGALRKTSSRLRRIAGAAGGFAGIGSDINISEVTRFLDDVEIAVGYLPKTILFTLNPSYNAALSILSGSYSRDGVGAVVSQGPAWWWCDHITGMREVFESLAVYSALSEFVGMTTDSRSFLSFVRHDYFRRALCSYLADKVERGDFPERLDDLKLIARKMCYQNAKNLIK